jgi:cellulose synthase/poly-beta-1,6-N-acetylglucosamine synthase-like glycosyltransferase
VQERVNDSRLHLWTLTRRRTTCGLQCGAFALAAEKLAADIEIVVTVDGDLLPHRSMLRELVAPFADERVGATFGNRWFMPRNATWGSLIRYAWNVAAVPPMYVFGIPWGGCFAVRRAALEASGLLECWSRSMVHDAPAKSRLDRLGLQVQFVPSLMMVLRESCTLSFSRDFLKRQMTWTRLYHPNWGTLLVHGLATTAIPVSGIALLICGAVGSQMTVVKYASLGMFTYLAGMLALMGLLECSVRAVLRRRQESTSWLSSRLLLMLPAAIPLTQAIYCLVVLEATFRRRVVWRGVTYLLHGPWDIELVDDRRIDPLVSINSEFPL